MPIRVALYGNMCNCLYQIAKSLRKHTNIEAHLFLDRNHESQMRPESDDPELAGNYPDWIHVGDFCSPHHFIAPFMSPLVSRLNDFDHVILCENGPIFAPFLKGKKAFFVGGGDLTMSPFFCRRYLWRKIPVIEKIAAFFRGYWQAKGIRTVDVIWSQPFQPFKLAQKRLGVEKSVSNRYFPIPIDADLFSPISRIDFDHPLASQIDAIRTRFDFTVFHPSRFMVDDSRHMVETGQWKNNQLLLEGFRQFVEGRFKSNPGLILIKKAGHEKDRDIIQKQIVHLGIEHNVYWLEPAKVDSSRRRHWQIPREQLAGIYSTCDCVADDFGIGWFGSVVLEGLASGKPVLNRIDENAISMMYPYHPIVNVSTPGQIASALAKLSTDADYYSKICTESREWVLRFHSSASASRSSIDAVMEFCQGTTT